MNLEIRFAQDRFIVGETIVLYVRLTNTGSAPAEVPDPAAPGNGQPLYTVKGPSYPEGHSFRLGQRRLPGVPLPQELVTIAPGETFEAEVQLDVLVKFPELGEHTISARFDDDKMPAPLAAGPIPLIVEKPDIRSARIMADDGFQKSTLQRVLALVGKPGNLYQFMYREQRPEIGEIKASGAARAYAPPVPATADSVFPPWANFDRSQVFFFRFGWAGPTAAAVESTPDPGTSTRVDLAPGEREVQPPLLTRDGSADAFVVSASSIRLVRFPLLQEGEKAKPVQEVWKANLPSKGAPVATAALGPEPQSVRYAMAAGPDSKDPDTAILALFDSSSSTGEPKIVEVPGAVFLPGYEPTLWLDAEGAPHSAALAADPKEKYRLSLIRVAWNPPAPAEGPAITRTPAVASEDPPPVAGVVTHAIAAGAKGTPARVDWVVLLEDGRLLSNSSPAMPQSMAGKPVLPLQLLSMQYAKYLLTHDEVEVLKFRNLR